MLRIVGGIIAGVIAFVLTLVLLEYLAHQLFAGGGATPSPAMLAFVALAYFLSALLGGILAGRISGRHWAVWVIALLVAAGAAYSLTTIAHPLWMQIASIVAPLLGGLVASRLVATARPTADAQV
jgi:nitrate/nitrite transporter NarK